MRLDERAHGEPRGWGTAVRGEGARRERLHRRVWDLLPWHVNGTLSPAERRTVEEHLAACTLCREEAERCRALGAAVAAAGEAAPSPHPVQLARLIARIEEAEARVPRRAGASLARLRELLAATPGAVRLLVAAQAAALLVIAAALVWRERPTAPQGPATYRTLAEDEATAPAASAPVPGTARIRVLFADGTAEREVRDLVAAVRGQIVGGPSPIGAYVIEIPAGAGGDSLPLVLAHLRSRPQVIFAEPVAGTETGGGMRSAPQPGGEPATGGPR